LVGPTGSSPSSRRWPSIRDFDGAVTKDSSRIELLPERVERRLRDRNIRHVLVVPHARTWDLPFTKIFHRHGITAAMSFHPCSSEVLLALAQRDRAHRTPAKAARRTFIGPDLGEKVTGILTTPLADARFEHEFTNGDTMRDRVPECAIAGLVCHGTAPSSSADPGTLALRPDAPGLNVLEFINAPLQECRLVILQSCWGGRIEATRRDDPVLGVSQILRDAGVGTVISARAKIPQELAPCVLDVLQVLVQFLPIEQALRECMAFLHIRWGELTKIAPTLASHDVESPLELEYRLFGTPGLHTTESSGPRRLRARLRWWVWKHRPKRWLQRHTDWLTDREHSETSPRPHSMQ
jgi:hypothetical protein